MIYPAAMARTHAPNAALGAAMYVREMEPDDLGAAVGVDVQTVRRWLRGESSPSGANLLAILAALDAPNALLADPPLTRGEALALMVAHDQARRRPPRP